jgi:hypothetical protein
MFAGMADLLAVFVGLKALGLHQIFQHGGGTGARAAADGATAAAICQFWS